jgi:Transglycosylase
MRSKRLIVTTIIVTGIAGLIILLMFQVGVDERVIESLLPRLEKRFAVVIEYRKIDASLTGLTINDVEIRPVKGKGRFVRIKRLGIGVRVGPLFVGDVDVTGVRLDGLEIYAGRKSGGASLDEWGRLVRTMRLPHSGAAVSGGTAPEMAPDIHIVSGRFIFNDGRFSLKVGSVSGRIGMGSRAVIDFEDYRLQHAGQNLLSGMAAELDIVVQENRVTVKTEEPRFELPASGDGVLSIMRDGRISRTQLLEKLGFIDRDLPLIDSGQAESSPQIEGSVSVIVREASGVLVSNDESEQRIAVEGLSLDAILGTDQANAVRTSGRLLGSDARFTIAAQIPQEGNPSITIEVPDMSLAEIGGLYFPSEHVDWSKAFADGEVRLEFANGGETVSGSGHAVISGLSIEHSRLALESIPDQDISTDFKLSYDRKKDVVHLERFLVTRKAARATIRGDVHLDRLAFDLSLTVPPTPCKQVLSAIPSAFKTRIKKVQLGGRFALDLRLSVDEKIPEETELEAELAQQCTIESLGSVPEPNYFRGPFAYVAYTGEGDSLRLVTGTGTDRWTPLLQISPYVIEAVLTTEDGKFWKHSGVTLPEVRRSIEINLKNEGLKYGASTITMQLAKNLFLTRERTVARKLQELFFVWYLEKNFSKEEILELYLNVIEFGPSLYGIGDASRYYFGREASQLNVLESVFLIRLLPNPVERHRVYEKGEVSKRRLASLYRVIKTMWKRGRLTEVEYNDALTQGIDFYKEGEPLPEKRLPVVRGFDTTIVEDDTLPITD